MAPLDPRTVPSPCRNICRLEGGLCVGCGRTPHEIGRWPLADDQERRMIRATAHARLAARRPRGLRGLLRRLRLGAFWRAD